MSVQFKYFKLNKNRHKFLQYNNPLTTSSRYSATLRTRSKSKKNPKFVLYCIIFPSFFLIAVLRFYKANIIFSKIVQNLPRSQIFIVFNFLPFYHSNLFKSSNFHFHFTIKSSGSTYLPKKNK